MNAASISISRPDLISDNAADSDSDSSSDGLTDYYQPISSSDSDDVNNDIVPDPRLNGFHLVGDQHANSSLSSPHNLPNAATLVNGVMLVELSGDEVDVDDEDEEEDEEEEEMRRMAEADAATRRAFLADELRRNAPLPSHTSARVIDAMRRVSFSSIPPHWALTLPEDRWVPQLHRLRHPPSTS